jgi:hypothetical protein
LELDEQFTLVASLDFLFKQTSRTTHKLSHPSFLAEYRQMESCTLLQPEIVFPVHPKPSAYILAMQLLVLHLVTILTVSVARYRGAIRSCI